MRGEPVAGATEEPDPIVRLARETGRLLAEVGVRPEDSRWVLSHAETVARLLVPLRRRPRLAALAARLYRFARSAARTAR